MSKISIAIEKAQQLQIALESLWDEQEVGKRTPKELIQVLDEIIFDISSHPALSDDLQ